MPKKLPPHIKMLEQRHKEQEQKFQQDHNKPGGPQYKKLKDVQRGDHFHELDHDKSIRGPKHVARNSNQTHQGYHRVDTENGGTVNKHGDTMVMVHPDGKWWDGLSDEAKKKYMQAHPGSKMHAAAPVLANNVPNPKAVHEILKGQDALDRHRAEQDDLRKQLAPFNKKKEGLLEGLNKLGLGWKRQADNTDTHDLLRLVQFRDEQSNGQFSKTSGLNKLLTEYKGLDEKQKPLNEKIQKTIDSEQALRKHISENYNKAYPEGLNLDKLSPEARKLHDHIENHIQWGDHRKATMKEIKPGKASDWWANLPAEKQKAYLKAHPGSKRKVTSSIRQQIRAAFKA